jgi:hypothetical protein
LGAGVADAPGTFPPTPAMKRFADSIARQTSSLRPGYKMSISICRKFLNEHAPKKAEGATVGKRETKSVSPAQMLYAKKIAQGKGRHHSRRGQSQLGCHVRMDKLEPKPEAPQARSQDGLQASGIGCASIDSDDEEGAERL